VITNADVTVFNRLFDKATKAYIYKKAIINGVWWYGQQKASIDKDSVHSADVYVVRIPKEHTTGYVLPEDYTGEGWTIQKDDYVVKGIYPGEIARPADLQKERRQAFKVTGWTDDRIGRNPHIKIEGV
jgi:hypothetical protein